MTNVRMIDSLETAAESVERLSPGSASTTWRRYPGPGSFKDDEVHRKLFRGRDPQKEALLHMVLAEELVVLYAESGCGKTSLVNVALMQPLRDERYLPAVVRVNDPRAGFFQTITQGLFEAARQSNIECHRGGGKSLWSFFKGLELWRDDRLLTPVIILDQFEELFTLYSPEGRADFIAQFAELLRGRELGGSQPGGNGQLSGTPPVLKIVLS